jgi:hypothetical protein
MLASCLAGRLGWGWKGVFLVGFLNLERSDLFSMTSLVGDFGVEKRGMRVRSEGY